MNERVVRVKHDHPDDGSIVLVTYNHRPKEKVFTVRVEVAATERGFIRTSHTIFGENKHVTLDTVEPAGGRFSAKRYEAFQEVVAPAVADAVEAARAVSAPASL